MKNSPFRTGMNVLEFLVRLMRINPKIKSLGFYIYQPKEGKEDFQKLSLFSKLFYHDPCRATFRLKRNEITIENLNLLIGGLKLEKNSLVGILSAIKLKQGVFHLPMMDFSCEVNPENLSIIKKFLKEEIGQKRGVLFSSGKSYHYYGLELLSRKEWLKFLGRCLLFTGYVDSRYVGHRLLDGCGILRISPRNNELAPKVISVIQS